MQERGFKSVANDSFRKLKIPVFDNEVKAYKYNSRMKYDYAAEASKFLERMRKGK